MFDHDRYRCWRTVEPPTPVWLYPARAWPPRLGHGTDTPMYVRSHGIDQRDRCNGWLSEWLQTSTGQWLAVVKAHLTSSSGRLQRHMTVLVPADAVEPRTDTPM